MTFENKVCVVTGAAQGIGLCISEQLLRAEAKVVLIDNQQDALNTTYEKLSVLFPMQVLSICCDLSNEQACQQAIAQTLKVHGHIDHLAHCAGLLKLGPLSELSSADFQVPLNVNTTGSFHILQAVAATMTQKKSGSIVVIGSNAADTPRKNMGAYCVSKAALHMLVKCFALELSDVGVRCNLVSPGSTRTPMQSQMWHQDYTEQDTINGDIAQHRLGIPLQKLAEPNDIAKATLFLLSSDAGHITMHDLRVDGGATL